MKYLLLKVRDKPEASELHRIGWADKGRVHDEIYVSRTSWPRLPI